MDGVQVAIFLVRCSAGLLICHDLPSAHLRFASMASCQDHLPDVVAEAGTGGDDGLVVMAKCRYLLRDAERHTPRGSLKMAVER